MNFKDYLAILEDEGLEETPLADGLLFLAMENKDDMEKKLEYIWQAIDVTRMYKDDPRMREFAKQEFEKVNGYKYKGFLYEYKTMKGRQNEQN